MFDPIESQIKRAEHAINNLSKNSNEYEWFQILLNILKDKRKSQLCMVKMINHYELHALHIHGLLLHFLMFIILDI